MFSKKTVIKINSECLEVLFNEKKSTRKIASLDNIICVQNLKKNIRIITKDYQSFTMDVSSISAEDRQILLKLINDLMGQKHKY